ncbi:hypothetical protein F0562_031443 [Nyssa sinensis]|uniref:PGG domain-containing protein n=1 Tax=Nyssa sinensis TaxID=561372 RepID=A0A5J5AVN1_9ASTE|nr:hypothetical protein F0562_031443 [Nyssa sinensis]
MAHPLLVAIANDDCSDLKQELENYLSQKGGLTWEQNPLYIAIQKNSVNCAKAIVQLRPDLLSWRNQDDYSVMHFICETGNVAIVKAIVEADPQVLNLLLSHNSAIAPVVQVNSVNKRGLTALDLHRQLSSQDRNSNDKDITNLLHQAVAKLRSELDSPTKQMMRESISSLIKSVLVTVFLFVAGAAYASLFNLNNIYPTLEHHVDDDFMATFHLKDMSSSSICNGSNVSHLCSCAEDNSAKVLSNHWLPQDSKLLGADLVIWSPFNFLSSCNVVYSKGAEDNSRKDI